MKTCTTSDLKEAFQNDPDLFLIDCRTPEEYEAGHVPGAQRITLGDDLGEYSWPKEKPIYVICRSGGRSAAFCQELKNLGVDNAVNVEGGTLAWVEKEYRVE